MRLNRLFALALAACLVVPATSCGGGDGGTPTGTQGGGMPGTEARTTGVQLNLVTGGGQTGVAGQPLANPIVVQVLDASNRAVAGATVNFIAGQGSASPAQANTDAEGHAQTTWTLGPTGHQELRVSGTGGTVLLVSAEAVPPARVARVQVIPDSLVLTVGATGDFNAVAYDSAGNVLTGRTVSWSSSDAAVATVAGDGGVSAVSAGSARVTATLEGVDGSGAVHVLPPPPARVARVVVEPDSLVLVAGTTGDFNAVAYDSAGNVLTGRAVTWTSSDTTVATLGTGGSVTAGSPGSARVTAAIEGVSGSATVRVRAPAPAAVARVDVVPDSLLLDVGETGDFDAVAYDAAGNVLTGRVVTWISADSAIVAVGAGGSVTGVAPGTARVRATVEGVSGSASVRVREPAPSGVARVDLTPDSLVLALGQTEHFTATAYDADGHVLTGRAISWSSSAGSIAIAGAGGAVTAVGYGTARVTATVEGVAGSAKVIVPAPVPTPVARVRIMPDSLVLQAGQTGEFDAVAYDSAGHVLSGRGVTWSISDSLVARLGSAGAVVGRSTGTARVTATVEGVTDAATVRVWVQGPPKVARVEVRPDSLVMETGDTAEVRVFAFDSIGNYLAGRGATLASTATGVATVGPNGTVIAVAPGSARITATVEGVAGYATVRVKERPAGTVTRVRVVPDSLILYISESRDIIAVAYDLDGTVLTGRRVYWSSSDPSVAPVYEGLATGLKAGFTRITATVEGVSYSIKVEVRGPGPQPYPGDRAVMWIQKRVGSPAVGPDYGLIDVTDYDRSVNFNVELGHTASTIAMRVRSPSGTVEQCVDVQRWNDSWREFRCVVYLPQGSEPGAWMVDRLTIDGDVYTAADLAAMRAPGRVFDVFRRGTDNSPPQVRGIWPHGWANGLYYVNVGVADHIAGVHSVVMIVRGPQGQTVSCNANASYGDLARLGDWGCALSMPANSGTWTVVSVTTTDGAGNTATYTPGQIEPVRDAFEYTWLTYEFFP
jgi:uncharacterized protein YjdB